MIGKWISIWKIAQKETVICVKLFAGNVVDPKAPVRRMTHSSRIAGANTSVMTSSLLQGLQSFVETA